MRATDLATSEDEAMTTRSTGYRRPPEHTRYQKGKSGNPMGRPKGSKNISTLINQTLYRPVTVTIEGKRKTVPAIAAVLMQATAKALQGDIQASKLICQLSQMAEANIEQQRAKMPTVLVLTGDEAKL